MKLLKYGVACLFVSSLLAVGCTTEQEAMDKHHFDNKLFINTTQADDEILVKPSTKSVTRSLNISTALEVEEKVSGKFVADTNYLATYRAQYLAPEVKALPDTMCVIENPEVSIEIGSVESANATVSFVDVNKLDRQIVYVMPVALKNIRGLDPIESKTVVYYVFKGAALINVVADISQNNFPITWKSNVAGLKSITVEALINVSDFGNVGGLKGENMSTLFGIEGSFLVRLGDSGFPKNQVQLVNPNVNFPSGNADLGLPTNEWVHVAVVWDATTGDRIIYTNGKAVASDKRASGTVNLTGNCYVGKAWNDSRWLNGCISELRIWSVQRTPEEIASNIYELEDHQTPGLIAYWKFDEGAGRLIKDYSPNGNNITAVRDLMWKGVSLP